MTMLPGNFTLWRGEHPGTGKTGKFYVSALWEGDNGQRVWLSNNGPNGATGAFRMSMGYSAAEQHSKIVRQKLGKGYDGAKVAHGEIKVDLDLYEQIWKRADANGTVKIPSDKAMLEMTLRGMGLRGSGAMQHGTLQHTPDFGTTTPVPEIERITPADLMATIGRAHTMSDTDLLLESQKWQQHVKELKNELVEWDAYLETLQDLAEGRFA